MSVHKNKTFATLLAFLLGALGLHRFYLYGWKDGWGWLHAASLPASLGLLMAPAMRGVALEASLAPLVVSALAGVLQALVIGLTPDQKWDARHNAASAQVSHSGWPLVLLLVLATGCGAILLIAAIARSFDLLYTGGAYG